MKKILYYSLVDWNWIKQRPQFIALGLAEQGFDVRGIYIKQYRQKGLQKVDSETIQLRPIYRIPAMGNRFSLINKANRWIIGSKIAREISNYQPDIIWLTHPSQLLDIPDTYAGQIVYDCMDNYDVLGTLPAFQEIICSQEKELCSRADIIFASSTMLQTKICSRNPDKESRVHLIRNGCNGRLYPRTSGFHEGKIYAGYVGTIAEWFDFDLLLESLERIPELEYFLIGPVLAENPPIHQRIHYLGTVAHEDLFDKIKEMDCMVMPFRLNDIVLSVDPVKLYEYISWQKNIITVDYPEIRRFGDFVCTYTDTFEYCSALTQLGHMQSACYSEAEAYRFLEDNSWKSRVEMIRHLMCP